MRINQIEDNIEIEEVKDFNLEQTLECGQCFHFDKIGNNEYIVVAKGKMLHVLQNDEKLTLFNTNIQEYYDVWENYFDLKRDYGKIKKLLLSSNKEISEAIEVKWGVRILNQDFFETLMSFIISQNKQIPHIKQIVAEISRRYGEKAGEWGEKEYYNFPTLKKLAEVTEEEFRECKTGFRAAYLFDACQKLNSNQAVMDKIYQMSSEEAREELLKIKGVGEKITNCVLLFGLSKREAFPVDVWIKRIMEQIYFHKETKIEVIQEFAEKKFGEYGGYAQQYLFYYSRDKRKNEKK